MPATIFDKPIFPGARIVTVEVEVSNVSGSYTNTVQDNRISASMEANSIEIDDPSVFRDKITVTSYNGSFVVSCPSVEGETTARISFLKIMDDQQVISSHEYDELNNNIGDLEDLETTDQSSVVNAVNEVINNKPDYATEMPMSDSDSTSVSQAIANKLGADDIADNLTTTTAGKVLDARQGAILSSATAIHEVTDCNDAIDANYRPYFFMCVTGSNRPDSNVFFGITMRYDNNNLGQIGFSSAGIYRRYRSWGTWAAWTKVG